MHIKLSKKILLLASLFVLYGFINLVGGIVGLLNGVSYGEYAEGFIVAGIVGYLVYAIYFARDKWNYLLAISLVGLPIMRFAMALIFSVQAQFIPSIGLAVLAILNVAIFGIVPLLLLLNKEIRAAFLSGEMQK